MSERLAGILLPVFSSRREGDMGIGDTMAIREWIDLLSARGVGFLQMLPINETGSDDSPYNAISSVALEPVYLACEEIPGIDAGDIEETKRKMIGGGEQVDYAEARTAKRQLLGLAWSRWGEADGALVWEFEEFCRGQALWLDDYCVFRWLMDQAGGSEAWEAWPAAWHEVAGARAHLEQKRGEDTDGVASDLGYFAWVQWLCFRQWRGVKEHAEKRGVKLMGDVPIGVSRCSADVFFGREDFDLDWCGGAPPETMFKHDRFIQRWGQNWGIPVYRWERMEGEDFPWWRQRIEKLCEVFHIFRVDHILGFYRIYAFPWRPQENDRFLDLDDRQAMELSGGALPGWSPRGDDSTENREQNRAEGDRRLRVILEAAAGTAVVGEDLGCVPDYVRPHLESLGIAGFRIPHWDADSEGRVIPGSAFPECSFATYATHDHAPLPAVWESLRDRAGGEDGEGARAELRRLAEFAGIGDDVSYDRDLGWSLIEALLASNSRYAGLMVTDLFALSDRINHPGTVGPQNWTYRFPWTVEECRNSESWDRFERAIEVSGRKL